MGTVERLVWVAPLAGALAFSIALRRGSSVDASAAALLAAERRGLALAVPLLAALLILGAWTSDAPAGMWTAASFALGAAAAVLAAELGLRAASLAVVGLGAFALGGLWLFYPGVVFVEGTDIERWRAAASALTGFVLGVSSVALVARAGGGVFTGALDALGAAAERAGAGVDRLESHAGAVVAAMVLGLGFLVTEGGHAGPILLPLVLAAAGLAASLAALLAAPERRAWIAAAIMAPASAGIVHLMWPSAGSSRALAQGAPITWVHVAVAMGIGLGAGLALRTWPAARRGTVVSLLLAGLAAFLAAKIAGLYGVAIAALGALVASAPARGSDLATRTRAYRVTPTPTLPRERRREEPLEPPISPALAGEGALGALALLAAFVQGAGRVSVAQLAAGMVLGAVSTFALGWLASRAAEEAAVDVSEEVRRQQREMDESAALDAARCAEVGARAALRWTLLLGALALAAPVIAGFGLGAGALGGLLGGALVASVLLGANARLLGLVKLMGAVALVIAPMLGG